ncbi:hypothetical protein N9N28_04820 [Rubripirellula amarantea]|nr:hypothetical protein [Rubripirellula amarantea]
MDPKPKLRTAVTFNPLDRSAELFVSERNLPHWFQSGAAIFVTFRTIDSMPKEVILQWQRELEAWLIQSGLPIALAASVVHGRFPDHDQMMRQLDPTQSIEFKRLSDRVFHRSLDECHGRCPFRDPKLAAEVAQTILHFDGQQYDLDRFVIMPNHAHAIVQFRTGFDLSVVGQSWMRFSARNINRLREESGAIWRPEPFDHIIRSDRQFAYLQGYISENPKEAKLRENEFLYWQRD